MHADEVYNKRFTFRSVEAASLNEIKMNGFRTRENVNPIVGEDLMLTRGLNHIERNHGVVVEDTRMVRLNEAHASHVCRKHIYPVDSLAHFQTIVERAKVQQVEFVAEVLLRNPDTAVRKGAHVSESERETRHPTPIFR